MLLAKQDKAGVTLTDEQNDFLFADATRMEEIEELNVNSGSVEYDNNVQASYALEQLALNAYKEAEKQQINADKVKQKNKILTQQLELYKEKVWVFEMTKGNNTTFFNEFNEANNKARRLENKIHNQFIRDQDIIRDLEQKRDTLQLHVVELKSQIVELQKTQTILKRKMSENEDKYQDIVLDFMEKVKENENVALKIAKVEVSDRTSKKPDFTSRNVVLKTKIVTDVNVKNALKAKDVLCVSCAKNVCIPCHDKCLANYKLNVHSKVRRALFTTHRTVKSKFEDTTPVISKTRFSVKTTQFKSLDTTTVVSKTKIDAFTPLSSKNKVSSAFKTIIVTLRDSSLSNYMKNKIITSRMWEKWYELQPNVGWSPIKMTSNVINMVQIVLWIVDRGYSKHMTGDRTLLKNFIEKFIGTVRFGNVILQQSQTMAIMYKATSLFFIYIMLKA
ncbi:hypothetical protein Tco_1043477 [Tanacetum coccineum]|uniref:Integrase, catalytic region, zinc finger, CCHC-type, peptidase aspartic, catalytic n=1 Tax=Tanacetum coccineum TaxID=301880 RepID=A0ABQ5GP73_9ASTR